MTTQIATLDVVEVLDAVPASSPDRMSLRELAARLQVPPASLLGMARRLAEEGLLDAAKTLPADGSSDAYSFSAPDTYMLAAKYSDKFLRAIVDRWQKLEADKARERSRAVSNLKALAVNDSTRSGYEAGVQAGCKHVGTALGIQVRRGLQVAIDNAPVLGYTVGKCVEEHLRFCVSNRKTQRRVTDVTLTSFLDELSRAAE